MMFKDSIACWIETSLVILFLVFLKKFFISKIKRSFLDIFDLIMVFLLLVSISRIFFIKSKLILALSKNKEVNFSFFSPMLDNDILIIFLDFFF